MTPSTPRDMSARRLRVLGERLDDVAGEVEAVGNVPASVDESGLKCEPRAALRANFAGQRRDGAGRRTQAFTAQTVIDRIGRLT